MPCRERGGHHRPTGRQCHFIHHYQYLTVSTRIVQARTHIPVAHVRKSYAPPLSRYGSQAVPGSFSTVSIVFGLRKTRERDREQSPDHRRELLARERCTVEICELLAYGYCHTRGSHGLELGAGPHRHA